MEPNRRSISEREFQRWVIEVAQRCGWLCWHVPAPMTWDTRRGKGFVGSRQAAGLADLILVHVKRRLLYFAEIKGPRGRASEKQIEFLEAITALGHAPVRSFLWRPGDEEAVERALRP